MDDYTIGKGYISLPGMNFAYTLSGNIMIPPQQDTLEDQRHLNLLADHTIGQR